MAVTITTNYGTFQAETMKEAKALASKREREEVKRLKEREAKRTVAILRSESAAYRLMKAQDNKQLARWSYIAPTSEYFPAHFEAIAGNGIWEVKCETQTGTVNLTFSNRPIAVILTPAGFTTAIVADEGTEHVCYAVGVEDGVADLSTVPGFTLEGMEAIV